MLTLYYAQKLDTSDGDTYGVVVTQGPFQYMFFRNTIWLLKSLFRALPSGTAEWMISLHPYSVYL